MKGGNIMLKWLTNNKTNVIITILSFILIVSVYNYIGMSSSLDTLKGEYEELKKQDDSLNNEIVEYKNFISIDTIEKEIEDRRVEVLNENEKLRTLREENVELIDKVDSLENSLKEREKELRNLEYGLN